MEHSEANLLNENPMKYYKEISYELKSKSREFLGLSREFNYYQKRLMIEYKANNDIKHIRDNGDLKEYDITNFFQSNNIIPKKYGVSGNKVRIASADGNMSKEMDLVFYDYFNNIELMNRKNQYKVFPVETVYGVMQIKSKLTKKELNKGLENIASFKRLKTTSPPNNSISANGKYKSNRGFGILFAYDTNMNWNEIGTIMKNYALNNPKETWCNFVVVLNKGMVFYGDEKYYGIYNILHDRADKPNVQSYDFPVDCLYHLYTNILELLNTTSVKELDVAKYYNMPNVSGEYSYTFHMSTLNELLKCKEHGIYLKEIKEDKIKDIVEYCNNAEPINLWSLIDKSKEEATSKTYSGMYSQLYVYNPENLKYEDILFDKGVFLFDSISYQNKIIAIPYYYTNKHELLKPCPKCKIKTRNKNKNSI